MEDFESIMNDVIKALETITEMGHEMPCDNDQGWDHVCDMADILNSL